MIFVHLLEDHPRVGGEKLVYVRQGHALLGSPPRGRGKGTEAAVTGWHGRITPAWAGKRLRAELVQNEVQDHPRVGGEKITRADCLLPSGGSPPRGRGKD